MLVAWGQADAALAEAESAEHTVATDEALRRRIEDVAQTPDAAGGKLSNEGRWHCGKRSSSATWTSATAAATWIGNSFDYAGAAAKYRGSLRCLRVDGRGGTHSRVGPAVSCRSTGYPRGTARGPARLGGGRRAARTNPTAAEMRDLAEAADDDGWRRRYRVAAAAGNRAALRDLSVAARTLSLPATSLDLLAQSLAATDERQEALTLLAGLWPTSHRFLCPLSAGRSPEQQPRFALLPPALRGSHQLDRAAAALCPEASAVHNDLGIALTDAKQWDHALAELQWAIDLTPGEGLHQSSLTLVGKGQLDQATESNRQAIHLDPNDPSAHHNLGLTLCEQQQWDAAIVEFKTAIALDANYVSRPTSSRQCPGCKGTIG